MHFFGEGGLFMTARYCLTAVVLLSVTAVSGAALASRIHTGEETGTHHARICPELAEYLARSEFAYTCTTSSGTAENVRKVFGAPTEIGFGQLDVYAREVETLAHPDAVINLRADDLRHCLFAVTKRRELQSYGELSALAPQLTFYLPPQDSNSAGTFSILQETDTAGLGSAKAVEHTASADEAIRKALTDENAVAFFVEFPNPDENRFKTVLDLGGHYVPVIDRDILRQHIRGQKVYFAQETQVTNADWLTSARKVVTACTPMILFTGATERITDLKARRDHEDLIATVRAMRTEALLPQESTFSRVLARTKELSASSAEKLMRASESARERARPYIDRAKEATDKALDAAKPALEKAKDYGIKMYERAREEFKELIGPKPEDGQPEAKPNETPNQ